MVVWCAESTSKDAVGNLTLMRTPFTKTIMCSSTLKRKRYVLHAVTTRNEFTRSQVYVLPDGYLVSDPSLEDIAFVLAPSFTPQDVANLSNPAHIVKLSYDLASKPLPTWLHWSKQYKTA